MGANVLFDALQSGNSEGMKTRLGYVSASYTSGRPKIRFDGETTDSDKAYPYAESYTPAAGDRVGLILFGHTWVAVCKIV